MIWVTGDIKYIDDSENGAILKEDSFSGLPGNKIEYTTQDKITDYENKGYLFSVPTLPSSLAFEVEIMW